MRDRKVGCTIHSTLDLFQPTICYLCNELSGSCSSEIESLPKRASVRAAPRLY